MGIDPAISRREPLFSRVIGLNLRLFLALASGLILLFLDAHQGLMAPVRGAVSYVTVPLQSVLAQPFVGLGNAFAFLTQHRELLRSQEVLTRQLATLQAGQLTMATLAAENAQLRALARLPLPPGRRALVAEVVMIPDDAFSRRLLVNKGADAGVQAGSPVIDAHGLVGQVTRVDATRSEVTTILSRQLFVPLQSAPSTGSGRTGVRLLGRGAGSDMAVEIPQMDAHSGLEVGDLLVTSGLDGVYPPGIPVARVQVIQPPRGISPFASAVARPVSGAGHAGPLMILIPEAASATPRGLAP